MRSEYRIHMPLGATPGLEGEMVRTQEVYLVASDTSPVDLVQDCAADNHEEGEQPVDRGKDRRKTERLFAYWQRLRDDRPFPAPEEIDCDQIGGLWPYCFLLPVQNIDNLDFSYLGCRISGGQGVKPMRDRKKWRGCSIARLPQLGTRFG